MHRLARVTERRDHHEEGPRGHRRIAFDPRRVVSVVEDKGSGGAWVHLALHDEWEGPAHDLGRHDGCRALLTREAYEEVLHEIDCALCGRSVEKSAPPPVPVSDLLLSFRARNCLRRVGIETVGQLCRASAEDLLGIRNFGQGSLEEVRGRLAARGLALGGEE